MTAATGLQVGIMFSVILGRFDARCLRSAIAAARSDRPCEVPELRRGERWAKVPQLPTYWPPSLCAPHLGRVRPGAEPWPLRQAECDTRFAAHAGDFWFDFVADTGDGFDATYTIARYSPGRTESCERSASTLPSCLARV